MRDIHPNPPAEPGAAVPERRRSALDGPLARVVALADDPVARCVAGRWAGTITNTARGLAGPIETAIARAGFLLVRTRTSFVRQIYRVRSERNLDGRPRETLAQALWRQDEGRKTLPKTACSWAHTLQTAWRFEYRTANVVPRKPLVRGRNSRTRASSNA